MPMLYEHMEHMDRPRLDPYMDPLGQYKAPPSTHSSSTSGSQSTSRAASLDNKGFSRYSIESAVTRAGDFVQDLPQTQFKTTLEAVHRKLRQAVRATRRNQHDYYFWVCDFLTAMSKAGDMFGPVPKPHFIRDLTQVSWILTFLEPLLLAPLDPRVRGHLRQSHISAFTDSCVMLKSVISSHTKVPCIYKDLIEELWDLLIDILTECDTPVVLQYSFSVLQTIISEVPLNDDLVCKVVLARAITLDYNSPCMVQFRLYHAHMFQFAVARTKKREWEYKEYLCDLAAEISRCLVAESDERVVKVLRDALRVANGAAPAAAPASSFGTSSGSARSVKQARSVADFRKSRTKSRAPASTQDDTLAMQFWNSFVSEPRVSPERSERANERERWPQIPVQPGHPSQLPVQIAPPGQPSAADSRKSTMTSQTSAPEANESMGYKEFRVSLREAMIGKLKSWRKSLDL